MKFPFQTILIGVCVLAFVGAILVFSGIIPISSKSKSTQITGSIVVWGVYPTEAVQSYIDQVNISNQNIAITYVQKDPTTISSELISALASDTHPDLLLASQDELFQVRDKLYTIPYATYPERTYKDQFVDGASLFFNSEGVLAIPLTVDPLVVYYNKNLLAGKGYITPPSTWQDMVAGMSVFFRRDTKGIILQTPIALGAYTNIDHFKYILSSLFLQTGNAIVQNSQGNQFTAVLNQSIQTDDTIATASALAFYTNFANPTSTLYSWSNNLPSSRETFISGRSTFYIGRASELFTIQSLNPNLSFDVIELFQSSGATRPVSHGIFSGVSIVKKTTNFPAAYSVLGTLSTKEFADYISKSISVPPVRRDLLLVSQQNPYVQVFFRSALNTFSWPDPNPKQTENIFRDMIQSVSSGRLDPTRAIYEASIDLQSALR